MTDSGNALFGEEAIAIFLLLTVVIVGFSIMTESAFEDFFPKQHFDNYRVIDN